ncbi:MAG TPA: CehA/McbA family metallohydrolase, partial [Planctomycetota bacterium]|nr:CehA/McbA family metallohydrolase [Planctomycetota bacterium]
MAGPDAWQRPKTAVYHLRSGGATPEWSDFAGTPDGREFTHRFTLDQPPSGEATILLFQDNVKHRWAVEVNGKKIGELELQEQPLVSTFTVPAGTLVAGTNTLRVVPPRETEDIRIGWVGYELRPPARALGECTLEVSVLETGRGLVPARVTVVDDAREALAALHVEPDPRLAARPGVVYASGGHAAIRLQAGRYTVTASRGFEYGLAQRTVVLEPGECRALALEIRREVPTPRLVAADVHVHTRELSGHGDSSVAERLVTLAGEAVELAVATEHNRHASYVAAAQQSGLNRHFTAVDGNEVTTPAGHFNVFPVRPGAPVPDAKETQWPALMTSIAASGAEVVILNHPRSVHSKFVPFGPDHFDPATGENRRGFPFAFHAIELVNSGALQTDFRVVLRDWFALLNSGLRVTAVGASDSHDVSRYIVGQGRTYVACKDDDPGAIDVPEAVRAIREGRASVSLGLLTTIRVNERAGIGDLATRLPDEVPVAIDVWGPSWTAVDRVELYGNGLLVQ